MLLPTKPPPTEASALLGAAADSPRAGVPKTDEPPPPVISSEGLQRFPEGLGLCGGVRDDGRRRARHCAADWTTGFAWFSKTLSASLFMFFATFFSTVALGVLISRLTSQRIGLSEFLLMNSVAGAAHALLGAQPLLILRPTGPITAIVSKLSDLADAFDLDFYQYRAAWSKWPSSRRDGWPTAAPQTAAEGSRRPSALGRSDPPPQIAPRGRSFGATGRPSRDFRRV